MLELLRDADGGGGMFPAIVQLVASAALEAPSLHIPQLFKILRSGALDGGECSAVALPPPSSSGPSPPLYPIYQKVFQLLFVGRSMTVPHNIPRAILLFDIFLGYYFLDIISWILCLGYFLDISLVFL